MANLFNALGSNIGNMQGLLQQFQQFKQTFNGDPQKQIQQMLSSGQISQEQYNNAVQLAKTLQQFMK